MFSSSGFTAAPLVVHQFTGVTYSQSSVHGSTNAATYTYMNNNSADGSANNNQTGTTNGATEWIRADCGSTRYIDHIVIGYDYLSNLPGGWGYPYTQSKPVYGSNDNTGWTYITTTPIYASTGSTNGLVQIDINQSWRYIKIESNGYLCCLEFELHGY